MDEFNENQIDCNDEDPKSKLINELQQKIRVQASIIQKLQSQLNERKSTQFLPQFHSHKDKSVTHMEDKSLTDRVHNDYPILFDLFTKTANHSKDFDKETFQLSNDVMFFSPKSHELLVKKMNFPSKYRVSNSKFSIS